MLLELFFIFLKIGAFTFGGGYAMLPIIQEEIVEKKGWIEEDKFLDALVVSQSSPGPVSVNLSIYTGYKLAGLRGALVATLGTIIPSFVIILVLVSQLYQYRDLPIIDKVFRGITPAVVGLIASGVYKLAKSSEIGGFKAILALITFFIIVIFKVTPIYLILIGGIASILYSKLSNRGEM